jgi:hypothetical protein
MKIKDGQSCFALLNIEQTAQVSISIGSDPPAGQADTTEG